MSAGTMKNRTWWTLFRTCRQRFAATAAFNSPSDPTGQNVWNSRLGHQPPFDRNFRNLSGRGSPSTVHCNKRAASLLVARALSGAPQSVAPEHEERMTSDFPGAKTSFTHEMQFIPETVDKPVPCFRVLDDMGQPVSGAQIPEMDVELAHKMYNEMVTLQAMDVIFYEAQRQGRFSFYLTTLGEEAINIATAAALCPQDTIYSQYREPGMLLWRGFTVEDLANQCFGNFLDLGKGRQMPIHYGSRELNFLTVSSTIATQIPQAVGAAYSLKVNNKTSSTPACALTFFGDGGTSEGDFHAGLNFAATLGTPTLFFCRNNGWAISTSANDQFKSDGVVVKGQAYGVCSIRVDGNDALAVYSTVRAARKIAIEENKPILIEALTYRVGHHSTSDDSSKYRKRDEIDHWRMHRDPVLRFKRWMDSKGWWDERSEKELRARARKEVISALSNAEKKHKPDLHNLFTDVYSTVPQNLKEQEEQLRKSVARCPEVYPKDVPF